MVIVAFIQARKIEIDERNKTYVILLRSVDLGGFGDNGTATASLLGFRGCFLLYCVA